MVFKLDTPGPVPHHVDLSSGSVVADLEGGDDSDRVPVPRPAVGSVGAEEPEDAELAGPEVHQRRVSREPLHGRPELLPDPAHRWRALGGGGGEVDGAERAVHGREAERQPPVVDMLGLAHEGQRPAAFLPPGAAPGVERVCAGAVLGARPDPAAGAHRVRRDAGAGGVARVGRKREHVPEPVLPEPVVAEGLEAAVAAGERHRVEHVEAVPDGGGDRDGLDGAHHGPAADGAAGHVVDDGAALAVGGHDLDVPGAGAGAEEEVEVDVAAVLRAGGWLGEARGGGRQRDVVVHGVQLVVRAAGEEGGHVDVVQRVRLVPVVAQH